MPDGKAGRGIESYSSLHNPKASPISNFYCRGYRQIQKYTFNDLSGKNYKKNLMLGKVGRSRPSSREQSMLSVNLAEEQNGVDVIGEQSINQSKQTGNSNDRLRITEF